MPVGPLSSPQPRTPVDRLNAHALPLAAALGCLLALTLGWQLFATRMMGRYARAADDGGEVSRLWGGPLLQPHPKIRWRNADSATAELTEAQIAASTVKVTLDVQNRRRGLTEFPAYEADFDGEYRFKTPSERDAFAGFTLGLPVQRDQLMLHNLKLLVNGEERPGETEYAADRIVWTGRVKGGAETIFKVAYRARGLERFGYALNPRSTEGTAAPQARPVTAFNFTLVVRGTEGTLDRPLGSMAPTHERREPGAITLVWDVDRLLTAFDVGIVLPDNRGVTIALAKLIDNAKWFYALYAIGLLFALGGQRARARTLHLLGLSATYFLYFPLATYLTAYLPWWVASAIALAGVSAFAISYAFRFVDRRAGQLVAVCQAFFLAAPAAAYLVPAHTGLILVVSGFAALGIGLHLLGGLTQRLTEREDPPGLPTVEVLR